MRLRREAAGGTCVTGSMLGGANVFHTTGVGVKIGVKVAVLLTSGVNFGKAADELFVEVLQPVSINKSPPKSR